MIDLLNRLPKKDKLPSHIVKKVVSLEEVITSLSTRISSHLRMSFREFTKESKADKVGVIVSFLAMLELVKNGVLQATQDTTFGDINMETKDVGVPRY
jgi:segregation and condensation protein A